MGFQEFVPHVALRPFVDRLWARCFEPTPGAGLHPPVRILPDGCIDVLVDVTLAARAVVVGTMTRSFVLEACAPARMVGARFRPGGAVPFLNVPAEELTDEFVEAAHLGLRWLPPLRGHPGDLVEDVQALERSLLERLPRIAPPDAAIAHAVAALFRAAPPSVQNLARDMGWSRQHLRRAIRRHVGLGPKQLARVARLQRAVRALQAERSASLGAAAARLGYFDQAHMAREFRELAGVPPQVVRASAGSIRPIPSLLADASSRA